MKKAIVLLFVCTLAACLFAADKSIDKAITISSATSLNGQPVPAGDYKVSYQIKGSTADVKFIKGGKTVATATGQVVQQKDPSPYNAVVNQSNSDGKNSVTEIQFAKEKQVIRLNSEASAVGK